LLVKDHAHFYTLARKEAHIPISLEINVVLRACIINGKFAVLNLFSRPSDLLKIHLEHSDQSL
jgi:hypothetical protein